MLDSNFQLNAFADSVSEYWISLAFQIVSQLQARQIGLNFNSKCLVRRIGFQLSMQNAVYATPNLGISSPSFHWPGNLRMKLGKDFVTVTV